MFFKKKTSLQKNYKISSKLNINPKTRMQNKVYLIVLKN